MLRRKHSRFISRLLAVAVTATSIFAANPVNLTQVKAAEVTTEASQVNAEDQIILHAKGTGLTLYAWKGETPLNGEWPGSAMEADSVMGSGWCYAAIPADCTGFIICSGGNKLTDDVKDKTAGEYWFVEGKFYDSDPEGPATPTPEPTPGPLNIDGISPEDGAELKAGEEQSITVDASSTINDKIVYYKYEVKCNGEYVGDHYYSKSNTYSFVPEDGKEYTVTVSVQAHDETNTTVTKEIKYTGDENGEIATPGPDATVAPDEETTPTPDNLNTEAPVNETSTPADETPDVSETSEPSSQTDAPGQTDTPDKTATPSQEATNQPNKTATPTTTPIKTNTPASNAPVNTPAPTKAATPAPTSDNTTTKAPAPTATTKVSTPAPTQKPNDDSGLDPYISFAVKGSASKKSPQKAGASIKFTATSSNGTGTSRYTFYYKKTTSSSSETTLRKAGTSSSYTWKPTKAGTYYVYVRAVDELNNVAEAQIGKYVINGLSATVKLSKKSPQKVNKKITITATPKNASGTVKYRFVVKLKNKKVKDSKYQSKAKYNWKPTKKGTYTLYVYVKDSYKTVAKKKTFKIK